MSTALWLLLAIVALVTSAYLVWRYVFFFRDPARTIPAAEGILSPADGTVVYVRHVAPNEPVVVIKRGLAASVKDIVGEDVHASKIVIGIFMSPFDVHYNRAPLTARIEAIRRYPGRGANRHMGKMHWRTLLSCPPYYAGSTHIVENERTVTRFSSHYKGEPLSFYVVQIGAKTVRGIDSFFAEGEEVCRGEKFGMIRVGSQVDIILPRRPGLKTRVFPGDRVRGGESILVQ